MAQRVDDGRFRLPSEVLNDDKLLMGLKNDSFGVKRLNNFRHGYGNSFGFSSDLSSPAESFLGATESDEDDHVTALTQKLACATLGDSYLPAENTMGWKSGSPQSTLCSTVNGCGCMPGLSRVSRVSVPPDGANAAPWHLLLATVDRDARMRLIEETAAFSSGNPYGRSRKRDTTDLIQGSGFHPNQSRVTYQQLQAAQFQQLKQQQQAGTYLEQGKIAYHQMVGYMKKNGGSGNQSSSMASWPDMQHCQPQRQRSSGMKAFFLGESETKSKRTGTGVFLPRNLGATPVETRCPVLLPDRVIQALNLNLKAMDLQQPQGLHTKRSGLLEANAASKHGNMISTAEQRRTLRPVPARTNQALKLPQEWTY